MLPVPCWVCDNTDLPLDSNTSKTVKVNVAFTYFKEYSISFLVMCRLTKFALVVLKLLMFKVCVIIDISKIQFFNNSGTKRVKAKRQTLTVLATLVTTMKIGELSPQANISWTL